MNERRRSAAYNRAHSQQSSQYIGAIALVFCAFLVWLWLYSPGSTDDATAPSFASNEVRDWLVSNRLQELNKDPKFIGKKKESKQQKSCSMHLSKYCPTSPPCWQKVGI